MHFYPLPFYATYQSPIPSTFFACGGFFFGQPSAAPESPAITCSSHSSVIALLRGRLAYEIAKFAELDESFLARKKCFLELELSLVKSASSEASLRSQVSALQADLVAARGYLKDLQSSAVMTTFKLDKLCTNNGLLIFQVSDVASAANGLRLQFFSLKSLLFRQCLIS